MTHEGLPPSPEKSTRSDESALIIDAFKKHFPEMEVVAEETNVIEITLPPEPESDSQQ